VYFVAVEEDGDWYWIATFDFKMNSWNYTRRLSESNYVLYAVFFWEGWHQELVYFQNGDRKSSLQ
jgi:hypothetical protein